MKCAVNKCVLGKIQRADCSKPIYLFKFPKNANQLKLWLAFCNQNYDIDTNTERMCSRHFKSEDFERNMKYELGFCKNNIVNLKKGAIPTVHVEDASYAQKDTIPHYAKKFITFNPVNYEVDENLSETELQQQLQDLQTEVETLHQENRLLEETETQSIHQIQTMERQIQHLDAKNKNMEKSLGRLFTEGQIKKLKNGDKRQIWTDDDIKRSLELYNTSVKVYNLLLRKNFPLPGVRTLQKRAQKLNAEKLL